MKALLRKNDNVICMIAETVEWNGDIFYAINSNEPWNVSKVHVSDPDDFVIVDIDPNTEIPDDRIDYKYEYNPETSDIKVSSTWVDDQLEF
jgi:hypothetical protein